MAIVQKNGGAFGFVIDLSWVRQARNIPASYVGHEQYYRQTRHPAATLLSVHSKNPALVLEIP